ncbi:hypothetical protein EOD39_7725 [Acipenser ruthenus]|uniref:Uncharacterized protein n=1 Tax=Acipenser ruthenus TaxID=7906 RepID=A0A662YZZ3_ACIRT|nr:hypothetical protein EOD39_7725 [Acipenser ruthenus]
MIDSFFCQACESLDSESMRRCARHTEAIRSPSTGSITSAQQHCSKSYSSACDVSVPPPLPHPATQPYSGLTMEAQSEEGPPPTPSTPVDQIFDDNAISLMASEWDVMKALQTSWKHPASTRAVLWWRQDAASSKAAAAGKQP